MTIKNSGNSRKKIEIIIEDHQAKNPLAATVTELIAQYKVLALTGGRASGRAVEIASVAQRLKTPLCGGSSICRHHYLQGI